MAELDLSLLPLYLLDPKSGYDELVTVNSHEQLRSKCCAPGAVLAFSVSDYRQDWLHLPIVAPALRQRYLMASLVLVFDELRPALLPIVRRCTRFGIRGAVVRSQLTHVALRRTLTDPCDFEQDFFCWLKHRLGPLPPKISRFIREAIVSNTYSGSVAGAASALGIGQTTLRRKVLATGLPQPNRVLRIGKVLRTVVRIQGRPDHSLARSALECGWYDHSQFSRSCSELLRSTPTEVQKTIGWEGWAERALFAPN